MSRIPFRLPMYVAAVPKKYLEDRNLVKGNANEALAGYDSVGNDTDVIAKTVTIDKKCLVIAVATIISNRSCDAFTLYRDSVNITKRRSGTSPDSREYLTALIYGYEELDAGTYNFRVHYYSSYPTCILIGASLEIVAVTT